MAKKRNPTLNAEQVLREVLLGAFLHIDSLNKAIDKLTDAEEQRRNLLTLTAVLVNDIIHPAHKICRKYFPGCEDMIDQFEENQKLAVDNKLVPPCKCSTCESMSDNTSKGSSDVKS